MLRELNMKKIMFLFLLILSLGACGTNSSSGDTSTDNSDTFLSTNEKSITTDQDSSDTDHDSSNSSEDTTSIPDEKYYVTFATNCSTSLERIYTNYMVSPPAITNGDKTLESWYFNSNFTNRVTFPYVVTADVTFYARWVESVDGLNLALNEDTRGYEIVSYFGNSQVIDMPSYYNDKPVLSIADYAFYENQAIVTIIFPNQLKSIGHFAFFNCSRISTLQFPSTLITIGTSAFQNVKANQISFGSSLQIIGNSAFQNTSITSIILPATLSEIGAYAFKNCSSLQKIYFASTMPPQIKYNSFEGSNVSLYVPNAVVSIYKNAAIWKDFADKVIGY